MPRAAAALPEVSADGRVFVLHVKPGIYFTPDPAFKGEKRELTAAGLRLFDRAPLRPELKSQWLFLVEGKIKGAAAWAAEARKTKAPRLRPAPRGPARARPLHAAHRAREHGLRFSLRAGACPRPPRWRARCASHYGDGFHAAPRGHRALRPQGWVRGSRVVLEANPGYREEYFESEGADDPLLEGDPGAPARASAFRIVGRIEINVIDEAQPRWLAFLNGEHDYIRPLPEEFAADRDARRRARAEPGEDGHAASRPTRSRTSRTRRSTCRPTIDGRPNPVGGYTPERIALRRAICHGLPHRRADLDPRQAPVHARATRRSRPRSSGLRPGVREPHARVQPGEGQGAARHVRLRRPRRRRLPRESRRHAACPSSTRRSRRSASARGTSSGRSPWTTSASA